MTEPDLVTPVPPEPDRSGTKSILRTLLGEIVRPIQHAAASAVGIDEEARVETVEQMLAFNARRAPGYWIQLGLAGGIAILGLVLGSTAVVIGAMLVSPLMGPILELGMGFAIGSSFLVIRSALRVAVSVIAVVIGTAFFTLILPFHEINAEIMSRTAPTALDLLVAIFCALTAVYTTVRQTSDTTAAAAGTAIGIALVPPICVMGYGIGTGSAVIAKGSALLFTANFSAILLFAVITFLLLGYNEVDAKSLEDRFFTARKSRVDRIAARAEAALQGAFGSRYGFATRLLVPGFFLAAVYFPLSSALDEVTKKVRDRTAIQRIVKAEVPDAVEQSVTVDRDAVSVRLLVIGDGATASKTERILETKIAAETQIVPTVRVLAVPDADALARAVAVPEVATPRLAAVEEARTRVAGEITRAWPSSVVGPLAGWSIEVPPRGVPQISVFHFGEPLGAAAKALLAGALTPALEVAPVVREILLDSTPITSGKNPVEWVESLRANLELGTWLDQVTACVTGPLSDTTSTVADSVGLAVRHINGSARLAEGPWWQFRWTSGACTPAGPTAVQVPVTAP